jgi:Ca-activated chloride channel homolog
MELRSRVGPYACLFVTVVCGVAGLQAGQELPGCAVFRADTSLVTVPVNVFDSQNRVVNHLAPSAFRVFEDGVEQRIEAFGSDDAPVSVGFVFDTSASMGTKLNLSRQAVAEFLRFANPEDESFLLPFDSRPGAVTGFSSRSEDILNQLASVRPSGTTAMLDAIQAAFLNIRKAHNARRAIIIVSDGGDNHSRATKSEILRLAREADAQVYAIGTFEPPASRHRSIEEWTGPELLAGIAEQTGGRSFPARQASEVVDAAIRIGFELHNQYLIAYRPANQNWNGQYRRISVEAEAQGFPQLRLYWRHGYNAIGSPCSVPAS